MNNALLFKSGIPDLDRILISINKGDNVVLQVEQICDFIPFLNPFIQQCLKDKKPLIYFRFANHDRLIPENPNIKIYQLEPEVGFEPFIKKLLKIIEEHGVGACYVFDLLSDLAVDWYSDIMIANFFMITCPYLYELDTVAYFAIKRNYHAQFTYDYITMTAQVIIDVMKKEEQFYIHPIKVDKRYTPTIFMYHQFYPDTLTLRTITSSNELTGILSQTDTYNQDFAVSRQDSWFKTFNKAKKLMESPEETQKKEEIKQKLIRMMLNRDGKLTALISKYFSLEDLMKLSKRVIGTGLIGGKSVGMLLARQILQKENDSIKNIMEEHDSFYIGADVFYTYLVQNKCWWGRLLIQSNSEYSQIIANLKPKMLGGNFPDFLVEKFKNMLDYFGQSPIIVRSSSLLEDAYGNAFSGKYKSIFLSMQGDPSQRFKDFMKAIKEVYASSINEDALEYRKNRGLLDKDEQMAILIQRVSGSLYGDYFFPHFAGVGFSFNPFVFNPRIDPRSGVLRMVVGLGTRAVDRTDDDYSRIIPINEPNLKIHSNRDEIRQFNQKKLDVINLQKGKFDSIQFKELANQIPSDLLKFISFDDDELQYQAQQRGYYDIFTRFIFFDKIIKETDAIQQLGIILKSLEQAYSHFVDIEFTINLIDLEKKSYKINLLQCRPFQAKLQNQLVQSPENLDPNKILVQSPGPVIGTNKILELDYIAYIVPEVYGVMSENERYQVAKVLGQINTKLGNENNILMFIGPGRWGTSTPSLGIPVKFAEINKVSVLVEVAEMHAKLIPDISLGTHFFNDLVELDISYFALNPNKEANILKRNHFNENQNRLSEIVQDSSILSHAIRLIECKKKYVLYFNSIEQRAICFLKD